MQTFRKRPNLLALLSLPALTVIATATIARADDPLSSLVWNGTSVVSSSYARVWKKIQSGACDRIRARIEQPGALGKGTTAYDTSCSFGGPGSVAFDASKIGNGSLGFTYLVPGNALDFRTKTPFGRWLDPRFHVTYDLGIASHVVASAAVPPVTVTDATATASNVQVHGGNVTGSLASLFISPAVNESVDLRSAFSDALSASWPKAGSR